MGFLGQVLIYIVPFLLVLTFIVTIHELGHFWVARLFKVKVDRFSVGFGRALLSRTDKHGIEWRLGWLPLGGYVKFSGDMDPSSVPDEKGLKELKSRVIAEHGAGSERDYFHFKPIWQRALIVVAGPAANFILSITLLALIFGFMGSAQVPVIVQAVTPGTPAAAAGFQVGDRIVAINGRTVSSSDDIRQKASLSTGDPLHILVERSGRQSTIDVVPKRVLVESPISGPVRVGQIGILLYDDRANAVRIRYNPLQAVGKGATTSFDVLNTSLTYLGRIVSGKENGSLLSGPIGIARAAGGVTRQATDVSAPPRLKAAVLLLNLVYFAAIVSIGIGFLNLLPIPVLDGGHLAFYGYEAVARRPVPARAQEIGYRVGLALLAGLMLFATWNDLQKLPVFKFLGGLA